MNWNRKKKIEFFNSDPNIIDNYPIIEYKDLKLKWAKRVREDFQNHVKKNDNKLDISKLIKEYLPD